MQKKKQTTLKTAFLLISLTLIGAQTVHGATWQIGPDWRIAPGWNFDTGTQTNPANNANTAPTQPTPTAQPSPTPSIIEQLTETTGDLTLYFVFASVFLIIIVGAVATTQKTKETKNKIHYKRY